MLKHFSLSWAPSHFFPTLKCSQNQYFLQLQTSVNSMTLDKKSENGTVEERAVVDICFVFVFDTQHSLTFWK